MYHKIIDIIRIIKSPSYILLHDARRNEDIGINVSTHISGHIGLAANYMAALTRASNIMRDDIKDVAADKGELRVAQDLLKEIDRRLEENGGK